MAALRQLNTGEALVLENNEWLAKYPPSRIARRLEKGIAAKFMVKRLLDKTAGKYSG